MSEKLTKIQQRNLERRGGVNPPDEPFSRRQFLNQVGGTAAVAGAAVGAGLIIPARWGVRGAKPPPPVRLKASSVSLPPSRPSLVVVRSAPIKSDEYASKELE